MKILTLLNKDYEKKNVLLEKVKKEGQDLLKEQ